MPDIDREAFIAEVRKEYPSLDYFLASLVYIHHVRSQENKEVSLREHEIHTKNTA